MNSFQIKCVIMFVPIRGGIYMLDFSVNYEYRKKLEQLLRTFTPEQKDLFEDWFELASAAISSMAMEYKVAGYKEGIATAKELPQIQDGEI